MNKKLYDNLFIHKETANKIEVAIFVSCDNSRNIVDTITNRIKLMINLPSGLYQIPLYLRAEFKKESDSKWTEWPKYFITSNWKDYFSRIYKKVWNTYFKLEITIYKIKGKNKKKSVKEALVVLSKIMKWLENSTLPRYFQGKVNFTPISEYLKSD